MQFNQTKVIPFYACGKEPYNKLSNFAFIEEGIVYDGLTYCSTEHAFQAQKYVEEQRIRFSIHGDLGNKNDIDKMFQLVFSDNWEKKKKYWKLPRYFFETRAIRQLPCVIWHRPLIYRLLVCITISRVSRKFFVRYVLSMQADFWRASERLSRRMLLLPIGCGRLSICTSILLCRT